MAEESFGLRLRAFIERISAGAVKLHKISNLNPIAEGTVAPKSMFYPVRGRGRLRSEPHAT